ncbi:hypothetical protein OEZ86_012993 [Tetradesmus obliquus]|nr:hypothetical protein OEZ86_012993 [Tetradesmus obliquus]
MRLDSKHSRGLWAVLALVVVLLLVSSVWRVNDGSEQADGASLVNGAVTSGQPSSSSSRGWSKIGRSGSSLGSLKAEKAAFLERHGKQYGYNGWLDKNWQREVGDRLGSTLRHYLDFTAAALVTKSHLAAANELLQSATFSNPHSRSPCGMKTTQALEEAMHLVLEFFNADPKQYTVIWTSGATQGLKMIGEYFPWTSGPSWTCSRAVPAGGVSDTSVGTASKCGRVAADAESAAPQSSHFVYLRSNHKSVLGIGGYARERGVTLSCADEEGMVQWLSSSDSADGGADGSSQGTPLLQPAAAGGNVTYSLVAYPPKDNLEGRLYDWSWVAKVHAKSTPSHRWLVVADAASYVPTHRLDLSTVQPDFVPISFYKLFGFPTGLGALIARKESLSVLHKVYFGGGSVLDATAEDAWRLLSPAPTGFEDGTRDFLGITQLQFGFKQLQQLGGIEAIYAHTRSLQQWTYAALQQLRHGNGQSMVQLFGRHDDPSRQSCIFQFLVLQPDGAATSQVVVEDAAFDAGLAIRTGCMCNPGQCQFNLGIQPEEERTVSITGTDCSSGFMEVQRPAKNDSSRLVSVELPIGTIRASLGYLSTFEDCYALIDFLESTFKDGRTVVDMSEQGSSRRSSINSEGTANGDRGPNTVQDGLEDADNADIDLQNNNKTIRDTMFATIYTLTNNRGGDTSVRMAVLKVVLEFLQLFCVVFNTSFPWRIRQDLWVYRAIQWVLFRMLVQNSGYNKYIIVMYCLMFLMVASTASAMWLAVVYKGEEPTNIWHKRLVAMLRLNVVISCAVFWPACLDFTVFMFDCKWSNLSSGQAAYHLYFTNQNCLAMPHIIHMVVVIFGAMLFIQSVLEVFLGMCDQNPLTRSLLARSDTVTTLKVTCFKMLLVIASAVLDDLPTAQLVIMMFAALGIFHCYMNALPFYNNAANLVWCGLSAGLLLSVGLLAAITFGRDKGIDPEAMTWALLYGIFPAVALGAAWGWVSLVLREMRVWDEDGVPDPQAAEFGEFVLKCAMARLPSNPELLLLHANFLIEVHKDGQAAHAQIQLAQKSNPGLLDSYSIYAAQQMSKKLQKESDGLDLLGYVEFQRNYRACVRAHKLALMAQRQFWSSLLRNSVRLVDLQASIQLMEQSEQRATAVYRRVLERYPSNGKVLKVYGRFLEFVRNEPGTAAKYYTLGLFGYEKGELEGKNVSVLMPAPLSTHHNSFLERYTRSGEPRILNIPRPMVALHKNRSLFPISLCATHISGSGDDCMFFGVVKPSPPPVAEGRPVVRFWTNHAGTVLCVDRNVADNFGHEAPELVGMSFSSLCTDVEGVDSYLSTALREVSKQYHDVASLEVDEVASEPEDTTFVAQVIHGYMPPVDVELSVEFGGVTQGQSDCRTICIQAAVLSESAATLVLDHKARVVYATDKLAAMLGYPVASLLKMELGALLPQPYCQMHETWFKDLTRKPGANSCRAGAVVHMLAANGGKVPVKLKMTTRENARDGSSTHVVQVAKASASDEQGQRRLLLSINHKGTILQVNKDTPKALYGFEPSQLLGRPLAAALDVFGHWRHHFGEDGSLLALLAEHSMDEESVQGSGSGGRSSAVGPSWRVGVHLPVKSDDDIAAHAALMATDTHLGAQGHVQASSTALAATGGSNTTLTADQASTFLHTLQQRKQLRPVCMTMAVIAQGGDLVVDEEQADLLPVLQVSLFRADALSSLIELDNRLSVTHADEAAGLMFGVNAKQLLKKNFARLVGLAPSTTFEDLLGSKLAKGAMKAAASGTQPVYPGASHMGGVKTVTARHLADGQLLALELQALSCSQGSKTRYLVRLQLHEPASSSLPALLQLKEGKAAAAAATVAMPPACTGSGQELAGDASAAMSQSGAEYEHSASADNRCSSDGRGSQGVRQASRLSDDGDEEAPMTVKHHLNGGYKERQAAAAVAASEDDGASAVYNVIDGASEAPSSMSSAAGEGGHEEDLSVDTRRAKRLKKLNHMVQSNATQTSTSAWKRHTLVLLAIMLVARIICFVVLGNEVADRRGNAIAVADMARVLDRFQSSTLRMALMQKCYAGDFLKTWSCSQSRLNMYEQKLRLNLDLAEMYHKKLFLKEGGLRIFDDPRLQYNWTYATWPEKLFFQRTANGSNVLADGHRTLWEMGNVYINAGREVLFRGYSGDPSKINESVSWQYAMNNGPASIFSGNAWSLDICVDHSVEDLVTLSLRLIILLIIEVVVVQLGCMAYEFYLLQRCNVSHMRLFSMFLALPSATVRLMAARQLQVDDDSREEVDEDELEALPETAATATEGDGANGADVAAADGGEKKSKQKSVRLDAGLPDDDDADDMPAATSGSKTGKGEKLSSGKGSSSSSKERSSDPEQRGTRLDAVHKALFGWMDPKIKKNGKKLLGSNAVTWRFMLLLGLWAAVLAAMYGISFSQVLGVREQLMSLDMAAHVQYRLGRCRHMANFVGYSDSHAVRAEYKARLQEELAALARDYKVLLYGGDMVLAANVSFVPVAPSAVLGNPAISDMFFTTKSCLRNDQSTCFPAGSQYYDITHSGLGAMIEEFISQMTSFSNLPDEQANATASSFVWMQQVIANDGYDALNKAIELFATWTINRLDIARQLHIGLLHLYMYGNFFAHTVTAIHMMQQAGVLDKRLTLVLDTFGMKLEPWHSFLLAPFTPFDVTTLSHMSSRQPIETPESYSPDGQHARCFWNLLACQFGGGNPAAPAPLDSPLWSTGQAVVQHYRDSLPPIDPEYADSSKLRVLIGVLPRRSKLRAIVNQDQVWSWCLKFKPPQGVQDWNGTACLLHEFGKDLKADLVYSSQADVMIGVHGEGLFNAFFMPQHSSLIEIRPLNFSGHHSNQYMKDMAHSDGDSIFWWGVNVVNPAHSAPGVLELQRRGAPHTWSRERHTFVRLMALQYLLERITLTRTDKARYHSFREKHEHYISDALEKLNDTQRHRLLHGVRGSVLLQAGGRRRLRGQGTARQLQRQQAQLLDAQQRQQQRQ